MRLQWLCGRCKQTRQRQLLLALAVAFVAAVGLVTVTGSYAVQLYRQTAYWAYWGVTALILGNIWRLIRQSNFGGWRRSEVVSAGLVILFAVWMAFGVQDGGLRIINDDTLQVQTSRQLYVDREAGILNRAHWIGPQFVDLDLQVDKRPAYFAWLVALVHTVKGYSFENAVLVSRLSYVALAAILFIAGRELHREWGGVLLSLLVSVVPLIVHHANGPGFEVFNLTAIASVWCAGIVAVKTRSSTGLSLLAALAVMAANVRYESVLILMPAAAITLYTWKLNRRPCITWTMIACAPLMLPRLWLQHVFEAAGTWQLESKPEAAGVAFSVSYFYENLGRALNFFLSDRPSDGNFAPLFVAGFVAIPFWLLAAYKERRNGFGGEVMCVTYIMWMMLTLHLGLMMVYFWGHFDDLATQRLAIPEMLWLAIPIVGVLAILRTPTKIWCCGVVALLIYAFSFAAPALRANDLLLHNRAAFLHERLRRWSEHNRSTHRLVVDGYSARVWLLSNNACISPAMLRARWAQFVFHWQAGTFNEVLFVQWYFYDPASSNWVVSVKDEAGPNLELSEVKRFWVSPAEQVRISRVAEVSNLDPAWTPEPVDEKTLHDRRGERNEFERLWIQMLP